MLSYVHGVEGDVDGRVAPAAAEPDGLRRPEPELRLAASTTRSCTSSSSILHRTKPEPRSARARSKRGDLPRPRSATPLVPNPRGMGGGSGGEQSRQGAVGGYREGVVVGALVEGVGIVVHARCRVTAAGGRSGERAASIAVVVGAWRLGYRLPGKEEAVGGVGVSGYPSGLT